MKFQQSGCLCAAKRRGWPGPSAETVERVRETFVRSPQKSTNRASRELQMSQSSVWRILRKRLRVKTWSVSPSVDMLPFGVTIPATVPQGSEIPEGLMNNPVYLYIIRMLLTILQLCARSRSDGSILPCLKIICHNLFPEEREADQKF